MVPLGVRHRLRDVAPWLRAQGPWSANPADAGAVRSAFHNHHLHLGQYSSRPSVRIIGLCGNGRGGRAGLPRGQHDLSLHIISPQQTKSRQSFEWLCRDFVVFPYASTGSVTVNGAWLSSPTAMRTFPRGVTVRPSASSWESWARVSSKVTFIC